jgi:hypothetical protein
MDLILTFHSIIRWLIIAVAAIAIIKFSIGWAGNSLFKAMDRGLASGFSGLMDLQVLLGLIYFVWNGVAVSGFPTYRILHGIVMLGAVVAAHLPARFKTLTDKLRFQYSAFAIAASLVLILIGISILPGGWR